MKKEKNGMTANCLKGKFEVLTIEIPFVCHFFVLMTIQK